MVMANVGGLVMADPEPIMPASIRSDDRSTPLYFTLPAPRGQILDLRGACLARTRVVRRLMLQVPPQQDETPERLCEWVKVQWPEVIKRHPFAMLPGDDKLMDHFKFRRLLPIAISGPQEEATGDLENTEPDRLEYLSWRLEYQREYPNGDLAAHTIGYVAPLGPVASGPLHHGEALWRQVEGRDGLEGAFHQELMGRSGLMMMTFDQHTLRWEEKVIVAPRAGNDVVTTLSLATQKSAEKALAESKRAGALVMVDATSGDILAMASAPTFSPSWFAAGMNHETFEALTSQASHPLHHRAVASLYPPGSVFKPFVALGFLKSGALHEESRLLCGPDLEIDGRKFGNWSDSDHGWFDLRSALIRSCNTYFYQAAMASGARPLVEAARDFGFGSRPSFPLPNLAAGTIPHKITSRQALANLSIGQGDVLVCPLQVTLAMAALANDGGRPSPRLVSQIQDQGKNVVSMFPVKAMGVLNASPHHLESVRKGMYGVVNHRQGTATRLRQKNVPIYGKTGTAQWSNQGKPANVVWFGGFVMHSTPPIAFAVVLEGKPGETISGGQTAAPVIGKVLADIAASPQVHGIDLGNTAAPFQDDLLIDDPALMPMFGYQRETPAFQVTDMDLPVDPKSVASATMVRETTRRVVPAAPVLKLSTIAPSSKPSRERATRAAASKTLKKTVTVRAAASGARGGTVTTPLSQRKDEGQQLAVSSAPNGQGPTQTSGQNSER
jgi:penicillin-binding protein 2